jgi:hypothetical protein
MQPDSAQALMETFRLRWRSAAVLFAVSALFVHPAAAAPDTTEGVALMSARVAANGNLVGGSGAVTSSRFTTGEYRVKFHRSVNGCTAAGSIRHRVGIQGTAVAGFVTALPVFGGGAVLEALVHDVNGQAADLGFDVTVFCPE